MLKNQINVTAKGKPCIKELSESERQIFFEAIYSKVLELYKKTTE